jgi:hypothetical protein
MTLEVNEGKRSITTLPEEAAHFYVELLDKNSGLYKSMYNNITSYPIYKKVVALYKDHVDYKGDEDKLRKEAIGKLIADKMVNNYAEVLNQRQADQVNNWWTSLWSKIKALFTKVKSDPYVKATYDILSNDITKLKIAPIPTQSTVMNRQQATEYMLEEFDKASADVMRTEWTKYSKEEFEELASAADLNKLGNYWTTGTLNSFYQLEEKPLQEQWNDLPFTPKGLYKFDYRRTISDGEKSYAGYVAQFGEQNVKLLPSSDGRYKAKISIKRPTNSNDVIEQIIAKEDNAIENMKELAKAPFEFTASNLVKDFDEFFGDLAWLEDSEKENMMKAIEMGEEEISCSF